MSLAPELVFQSKWNLGKTLRPQLRTKGIFLITVKDTVAVHSVINDIVSELNEDTSLILLTGPTPPTEIYPTGGKSKVYKAAWVTTASGGLPEVQASILSPYDPTGIVMFITDVLKTVPPAPDTVVLGDFLDNLLPQIESKQLSAFISSLTALLKLRGYSGIFITSSESHETSKLSILKRFADIIGDISEDDVTKSWRVTVWNKLENSHARWTFEGIVAKTPWSVNRMKKNLGKSRLIRIPLLASRELARRGRLTYTGYLRPSLEQLASGAHQLFSNLTKSTGRALRSSTTAGKMFAQKLVVDLKGISYVTSGYFERSYFTVVAMLRRWAANSASIMRTAQLALAKYLRRSKNRRVRKN